MALCTTMSSAFNKTSLPYYPSSLHKLRRMYRKKAAATMDIELNNRIQLPDRFNRSLSMEGCLPQPTETRFFTRRISFIARQTSYEENDELFLPTISNDLRFFSTSSDDEHRYYSTKKPYPCPSKGHCLSSPPQGYKPIGIQLLARHGSRALTNHNYDIELLQIWQIAKENNLLTKLGEDLEDDTRLFMQANNHIG